MIRPLGEGSVGESEGAVGGDRRDERREARGEKRHLLHVGVGFAGESRRECSKGGAVRWIEIGDRGSCAIDGERHLLFGLVRGAVVGADGERVPAVVIDRRPGGERLIIEQRDDGHRGIGIGGPDEGGDASVDDGSVREGSPLSVISVTGAVRSTVTIRAAVDRCPRVSVAVATRR